MTTKAEPSPTLRTLKHPPLVAVQPFDNLSASTDVQRELLDETRKVMRERLNLREATEAKADVLVRGTITQYEVDLADPGSVWRDPVRRAAYLRMYGNICYDSRDRYVNFPWSSERR